MKRFALHQDRSTMAILGFIMTTDRPQPAHVCGANYMMIMLVVMYQSLVVAWFVLCGVVSVVLCGSCCVRCYTQA